MTKKTIAIAWKYEHKNWSVIKDLKDTYSKRSN